MIAEQYTPTWTLAETEITTIQVFADRGRRGRVDSCLHTEDVPVDGFFGSREGVVVLSTGP